MQISSFLLVVSLIAISALAKIVKVQDPIFHATKIKPVKVKCMCKRSHRKLLNVDRKETASALYYKMLDKKVRKVLISEDEVVVRKGKHLKVYNLKEKDSGHKLPYVCGSKTYEAIIFKEKKQAEEKPPKKAASDSGKKSGKKVEKPVVEEKEDTNTEVENSAPEEHKEVKKNRSGKKESAHKAESTEISSSEEEEESSSSVESKKSSKKSKKSKHHKKSKKGKHRKGKKYDSSSSEDDDLEMIIYKKNVSSEHWDKIIELLFDDDKSHKKIQRVKLSQKQFEKIFKSKKEE
jgi:hypothetical protein